MIKFNEYFQSVAEVQKLGFSNTSDIRIPLEYLEKKQFILFRTCHSYGDWVILSAMPRLLKQKYPDCIIIIPSPECISKYFSPNSWLYRHDDPFNNVIEIFKNNPYVDGMIDYIPQGIAVYHDHFRIYDPNNTDIPLIQQILKFWRFEDNDMEDCQPELYWDDEEKKIGDNILTQVFDNKPFGFLYLDEVYFNEINSQKGYDFIKSVDEKIKNKRFLIQKEIEKYDLPWLYYSGKDSFMYKTNNKIINVKDISMSLRIQQYIKSKSTLIIGHQGGYGTDCMPRYTKCYVVPLFPDLIGEHIIFKTTYLI